MKSQNTKSTHELKRDVHTNLQKVNGDIDRLQKKLTPGQLIDDAIFKSRGETPLEVFNHLKNNPIGTTFLSLGTLLLMEDDSHQSYEAISKNKVSSGISSTRESIKRQLPHNELAPGETPNKADLIKSRVNHMKDSFDQKVDEIKRGLDAKIPDRVEAGNKLQSAESKLSSTFDKGKDKIKSIDHTALMAIGAGLGAITGGALPTSEAEEKLMGDKFDSTFSDLNHDFKEALNECSNVLKELVVQDVKDFNINLF